MSASHLWENYFKLLPEECCQSAINYMLGALMADRSYGDISACIKNVDELLGNREGSDEFSSTIHS